MIVFDLLLLVTLVLVAWHCVTAADMYRAIVLFIVLGFTLALSWARLGAPDVALAEAAIGAGLLGVLLIATWRALGSPRSTAADAAVQWSPTARWALRAGAASVALMIAVILHQLPGGEDSGGALALANLADAGTSQPVTAVLLNFRALDTLLELVVLLMALLGVILARAPLLPAQPAADASTHTPMTPALVKLFAPLLMVAGAWLLWAGSHAPGGAFQGGAVIAGAGVLLALGGRLQPAPDRGGVVRLLLALGLVVFITVGLLVMPEGDAFLAYPSALTYPLMLLIEYCVAISIALALILIYTGTEGVRRRQP